MCPSVQDVAAKIIILIDSNGGYLKSTIHSILDLYTKILMFYFYRHTDIHNTLTHTWTYQQLMVQIRCISTVNEQMTNTLTKFSLVPRRPDLFNCTRLGTRLNKVKVQMTKLNMLTTDTQTTCKKIATLTTMACCTNNTQSSDTTTSYCITKTLAIAQIINTL